MWPVTCTLAALRNHGSQSTKMKSIDLTAGYPENGWVGQYIVIMAQPEN